ncbi:hypothetical protein HK405_015097, partial [Cladochytrium tenue]
SIAADASNAPEERHADVVKYILALSVLEGGVRLDFSSPTLARAAPPAAPGASEDGAVAEATATVDPDSAEVETLPAEWDSL